MAKSTSVLCSFGNPMIFPIKPDIWLYLKGLVGLRETFWSLCAWSRLQKYSWNCTWKPEMIESSELTWRTTPVLYATERNFWLEHQGKIRILATTISCCVFRSNQILIKLVDSPHSFIVNVNHLRLVYFSLTMLCLIISCYSVKRPGHNSHHLIAFPTGNWCVGLRVKHNIKISMWQFFHFLYFFQWGFHAYINSGVPVPANPIFNRCWSKRS